MSCVSWISPWNTVFADYARTKLDGKARIPSTGEGLRRKSYHLENNLLEFASATGRHLMRDR